MKRKSERIYQDLRRRVAHNLARLRAKQGLTFEELGERAGLHYRHLQKIEAGEANITLATIARLATGLEVDARELMIERPAR